VLVGDDMRKNRMMITILDMNSAEGSIKGVARKTVNTAVVEASDPACSLE